MIYSVVPLCNFDEPAGRVKIQRGVSKYVKRCYTATEQTYSFAINQSINLIWESVTN